MSRQQWLLGMSLGMVFLTSGCEVAPDTDSPTAVDEVSERQDGSDFPRDQNADFIAPASAESALWCHPDDSDLEMLALVNQARASVRQCGNEIFQATQPLQWHCDLEKAAIEHSEDMTRNNFFSHQGSDGLSVANRVEATGYPWRAVGENIAAGYSSVKSAVQGWLESPGHCKNIMNPDYSEFGSAVMYTQQSDFTSYWTQVFGDPG